LATLPLLPDTTMAPTTTTTTAPRVPQKIALIGFGAIGRVLCDVLAEEPLLAKVSGALVTPRPRPGDTASPPLWTTLDALLASAPDLVVECAGTPALDAFAAPILRSGCDLLMASVGALADPVRQARLLAAAEHGGSRMLLSSGAIGGLDHLAAARRCGLQRVQLRSSKPPAAWRGTAAEARVDLDAVRAPVQFFSGSARAAAMLYPKNANVAAALALATLGFDATEVELIVDPGLRANVHEVNAEGRAGRVALRFEGSASANPGTSLITAYALADAVLKRVSTIALA
jgi:aspartate dehydrogenase